MFQSVENFHWWLLYVSDSGELTDVAQCVEAGVADSERKVISHDNGWLHTANTDPVLTPDNLRPCQDATDL